MRRLIAFFFTITRVQKFLSLLSVQITSWKWPWWEDLGGAKARVLCFLDNDNIPSLSDSLGVSDKAQKTNEQFKKKRGQSSQRHSIIISNFSRRREEKYCPFTNRKPSSEIHQRVCTHIHTQTLIFPFFRLLS